MWDEVYPFGDYANLQPVENWNFQFPENSVAATLKLVSTGHGWGDLNTGNAAEFYEATHHIWVNGDQAFEQYNWYDCNPNPDGCQPQNGTWFYNRAGWCPGAIAQWFDYNMTPYVAEGDIEMDYVFYENYVDLCHPNHPDCVTGVTCTDCDDGFNPMLDVACNLIVFAENPILVGTGEKYPVDSYFNLRPNPTNGFVEISVVGSPKNQNSTIQLFSSTGVPVEQYEWNGKSVQLDLTSQPKGIYLLKIQTPERTEMKKLIIQ